ncbi:VOC family protein [Fundidesulfovibrio putealis]|uniref:VOC family protein n=1 Tax=Fundidesulfovibrio putealis TaxID=270496 RepID=UPI00040905C8|nr:VOC family protein [Fundidesulfovibrio putealis]
MQAITPCLWFDGKAEEAANFYISVFKNAKLGEVMRYGEAGPGEKGSVLMVTFTLNGQEFSALNGGPEFQFTPAISFAVPCDTQEEIDHYWTRLLEGGAPMECGWLSDKFGVSWQIFPAILPVMLRDKDARKADNVMRAMLKMVKLDIALLRQAYEEA